MNGQDPGASADAAAVAAFKRLRNILLASHWLSPAMQYVQGLIYAGRLTQGLDLMEEVSGVLEEVLPNSDLHVATAMQRAVCAAESGMAQDQVFQLLAKAACITDAAYGDGWATLEAFMETRISEGDEVAALLGQGFERFRSSAQLRPPPGKQEERDTAQDTSNVQGKIGLTSTQKSAAQVPSNGSSPVIP